MTAPILYNGAMRAESKATSNNLEKLLPVLVYIQVHLDEVLPLEQMAEIAGLSAYHFHRLFHETIGETPKEYTRRLQLERAAYQLKIRDDTILNVALNNGFHHHETFSRSFKAWFGVAPRQYRHSFGRMLDDGRAGQWPLNPLTDGYQLSRVTVQRLNPIPVAFIRHLGPYTAVDATLYDRLLRWADSRGLYTADSLLLGVGHDDPSITAPDKVRYDICVSVAEPFAAEGEIGYQALPGGQYATAAYLGPFGPTLEAAYRELFGRAVQLPRFELIGLPVIEIYHTTRITQAYQLNHVDIYLPVQRTR
jgi:AraC family transcriptional regulator